MFAHRLTGELADGRSTSFGRERRGSTAAWARRFVWVGPRLPLPLGRVPGHGVGFEKGGEHNESDSEDNSFLLNEDSSSENSASEASSKKKGCPVYFSSVLPFARVM